MLKDRDNKGWKSKEKWKYAEFTEIWDLESSEYRRGKNGDKSCRRSWKTQNVVK